MKPRSLCVLVAALAVALAALACAPHAHADEWVLVVDADTADAPALDDLPEPGQALWTALTGEAASVRLLAARHPLLALPDVMAKAAEDEPQQVVFVGAFDPLPDARDGALEKARKAWGRAPEGSRLMPLEGMAAGALEALEGLAGVTADRVILIAFGEPTIRTEPFSPLDPEDRLRATVTVPVTELRLALTPEAGVAVPLVGTPTLEGDTVTAMREGRDALRFRVERSLEGPREGRLAFLPLDHDGVVRIAPPPPDPAWRWDRLEPAIRIRAADGETPGGFDASGTQADAPQEARYRVEATRPATADLRPEIHVGGAPREVAGLRAWLTPFTQRDAEVAEAVLHVRYAPRPAAPDEVEGEIRLGTQRVAFRVATDRGRARLVGAPPAEAIALPRANEQPSVTLEVRAENGNMPASASLELVCEPEAYAERVRLRVYRRDGTEQRIAPGSVFRLPTGDAVEARIELADRASWGALEPGALRIRPASQAGVTVEGTLTLPYRFRQARLRVADAPPRYRVVDAGLEAVAPLRLVVDADGGDGAWLLERLAVPPRVAEQGGTTRADWTVIDEGSGAWRVEARGAWRGLEPEPFSAREARVAFEIAWDAGLAPDPIEAVVEVPARWGRRGWVFVGLAALAIALGVGTFLQLRAAPVRGTLLYAVEGLDRTVGRVDLAGMGRRAVVLRADARGRVDLGDDGQPIGTIRPTRVGAMLEVPGDDGEPERRLLVDGLSVRTGRHTLRYVSGDADEVEAALPLLDVPDLLGPEFDLESGAVDALPEG